MVSDIILSPAIGVINDKNINLTSLYQSMEIKLPAAFLDCRNQYLVDFENYNDLHHLMNWVQNLQQNRPFNQ